MTTRRMMSLGVLLGLIALMIVPQVASAAGRRGHVRYTAHPARSHGLSRYAPGEIGRLQRQSFDYYYRNSNNNVYRSSRQNHPTRNVFRSSRHYQRRLAASYDGYPLRSWVTYSRHGRNGRSRAVRYSYAYPDRHHAYGYGGLPYLPSVYPANYGYAEPAYALEPPILRIGPASYQPRYTELPPTPEDLRRLVIHAEPRRVATQRAVSTTVTTPDGRVKTVITSEPIEERKEEGNEEQPD